MGVATAAMRKGVGSMSVKAHANRDAGQPAPLSSAREVAAIAHDFRNMLQCATSAVTVAGNRLKKGNERQVSDLLEDALAALDRAGALAHRLILKQNLVVEVPPLSIARTIIEMRSILRHAVGSAICLETSILDDLPAIAVDRADLENALLNLAINAREAMPSGGRLFIKASRCLVPCSGRQGVKLSISDTGCGMAPAIRALVLTCATSTKGQGRGIGLSTIGKFARAHGGTIEVESVWGGGTCVKIFLPTSTPVLLISNPMSGKSDGQRSEEKGSSSMEGTGATSSYRLSNQSAEVQEPR
jgi:signal transduction histidine kinase